MVSFKDFIDAGKVLAGIAGACVATTPAGAAMAAFTASGAAHDLSSRFAAKPKLVERIASEMATAVQAQRLTDDQRALVIQMTEALDLPALARTPTRDPAKLAAMMLQGLSGPDFQTAGAPEVFRRTMIVVLGGLFADNAVLDELRPIYEAFVTDRLTHIAAQVDRLVAQMDKTARDLGLAHGLVMGIARTYATGEAETFNQALRGIEEALRLAADLKVRGALPQNIDAQLQAVLRKVSDLNDQGRVEEAANAVDDALRTNAEEQQRRKAERLALLDLGIHQDRLRNNPESAAARVAEKALAEAAESGLGRFNTLRAIFVEWYEHGRDKGLNFDLQVSIDLSKRSLIVAIDTDQRGTALNDRAAALSTLGEREPGTAHLEEAVATFRAALKECTRDRVPLDWAMTQMNLANALSTLGERELGTARLDEAVTAYRAALEERTRDRMPLQWAMTQMNLANALKRLGEREPGTARLKEAVNAYRAALEEWTRDRVPLQWAGAQVNLGSALKRLGERELGSERLEEAVAAYRAALEEWTRDRVPLNWAGAQVNLGNALATLGQREPGTARLEEAVAACRAALEEQTRDRVPLDWAMTQMNLANALSKIGEREPGTSRLEEAVAAYRAALEERTRDRVPLHWAMAQVNLGSALKRLGEREMGTARLDEAVSAYRLALEELTRDRVPLEWANTIGNLGSAQITLADRSRDLSLAREALANLTLAEQVLRDGGHVPWADFYEGQIPAAQALIDRLSSSPPAPPDVS